MRTLTEPLRLPFPTALPSRPDAIAEAVAAVSADADPLSQFADPVTRTTLRAKLIDSYNAPPKPSTNPASTGTVSPLAALKPPTGQALGEQVEHDRYFEIERAEGEPARGFVAGFVLAHLSAYENCLAMGVSLLDGAQWERLFAGLTLLLGAPGAPPPRPQPAQWREGYDPAERWLIGHQLFFTLIQGSIIGLNRFAEAAATWSAGDEPGAAMADGLEYAATFLRASAAAMRYASDFAPADYDRTVRPDMAPPKVRAGFSGFQTRDHAHLVRLLGALKPTFAALDGRLAAHKDLVDAVVSAYEAHEFICARFRGDVLPSLRMAAAAHGRTDRAGVEVVRELMRKRLALVDPASPGEGG